MFGSTHEHLLFSLLPSILTFDVDLIMGSCFTFWSPNGLIWGKSRVQDQFWGLLMLVVHLSFSMFSSILNFNLDLSLGSFLLFSALIDSFWSKGMV